MRVKPNPPVFNLADVPEKDRDRVAAMIPDPRIAKQYVHRNINGILDFDYLDGAIADKFNITLAGPTGSAKSTLLRAYAAYRRLPIAVIDADASMDFSTIIGGYDLETHEWVDGRLALVVRYGGIAVVEEFNMISQRVGAAFHDIFSVNRQLAIPEHKGEVIIAGRGHQTPTEVELEDGQTALMYLEPAAPTLFASTYNPRELGYHGVLEINQATLNRFAMPFKWDYDHDVELELLDSPTLLTVAEGLRAREEIRTPVPTNALQEFEALWWRYGWESAQYFFLNRFKHDEQNIVEITLFPESENIVRELEAKEAERDAEPEQSNGMIVNYQIKAKPKPPARRRTPAKR